MSTSKIRRSYRAFDQGEYARVVISLTPIENKKLAAIALSIFKKNPKIHPARASIVAAAIHEFFENHSEAVAGWESIPDFERWNDLFRAN